MSSRSSSRLSARVPDVLAEEARRRAQAHDLTVSDLVVQAVSAFLGVPLPPPARRPFDPAHCGTQLGYTQHRRLGQTTCPACRAAESARVLAGQARRRAAAEAAAEQEGTAVSAA